MKLRMKPGRKVSRQDGPQYRRPRTRRVVLAAALLVISTACQGPSGGGTPVPDPTTITGSSASPTSASPPDSPGPSAAAGKVGHIFVINLENQSYNKTWGPGSAAPYLSQTLRSQGVLLTQ